MLHGQSTAGKASFWKCEESAPKAAVGGGSAEASFHRLLQLSLWRRQIKRCAEGQFALAGAARQNPCQPRLLRKHGKRKQDQKRTPSSPLPPKHPDLYLPSLTNSTASAVSNEETFLLWEQSPRPWSSCPPILIEKSEFVAGPKLHHSVSKTWESRHLVTTCHHHSSQCPQVLLPGPGASRRTRSKFPEPFSSG